MLVRRFQNGARAVLTLVTILIASSIVAARAQAATPILNANTVATVAGYKGTGDRVDPIAINDTKVPFKQALRVSRATVGQTSYDAAMLWSTVAPVKKGDLLVATFYLRNMKATQGPLNLDLTFQLSDTPYTWTLTAAAPVDTQAWQKYAIPFRANQDYPKGGSSFQIRYGAAIQSFDVGGVTVVNHGQVSQAIPKTITDTFAYYYPGRGDAKATWRKEAAARIETLRKGNMIVRVIDASGRPLSGAKVRIDQTRSAFNFGTATSAISLVCKVDPTDSVRPCPTNDQLDNKPVTPADYRKLRSLLLQNFNGGSFYNDLKWPEWQYNRKLALEGIAWFKKKNFPLQRGHALIWPGFDPDYLMPKDLINPSTPPAQARKVIAAHFADELSTLRGQVPEWDVVNEPYSVYDVQGRIAAPNVKAVKGLLPIQDMATWYKDARRLDPKALLFLNDFSILENLDPVKQRYDVALLKYIKSLGAPVDGMGFQAHFGASGLVINDMQRVINEFSPLVKTMSVTEFDFTTLDPKLQADLMGDFLTFIFSQPKFNTFQMWGFWDGDHWLGSGPLYNYDWTLKPSGAVWQKLTRQSWITRNTGLSTTDGTYKLKAFYGTHKITVTFEGKTCVTTANFTKSGTITARATC